MALADKKPKKQKSSLTRRERKADEMYKTNPTWAAEDDYRPKKMQTGGGIEGYKETSKTRNKIGGGKVVKTKETFIGDIRNWDKKQVDRKTKKVYDKEGKVVSSKLKDTSRPTVSSKDQKTSTRVMKTKASGRLVDRDGKTTVKSGVAYKKTGGMINPNAKVSVAKRVVKK